MKLRQVRTCPLCLQYRNFRGWTFPVADIDQERTFNENRKPTQWKHVGRLGRFLHHQAEAWQSQGLHAITRRSNEPQTPS